MSFLLHSLMFANIKAFVSMSWFMAGIALGPFYSWDHGLNVVSFVQTHLLLYREHNQHCNSSIA